MYMSLGAESCGSTLSKPDLDLCALKTNQFRLDRPVHRTSVPYSFMLGRCPLCLCGTPVAPSSQGGTLALTTCLATPVPCGPWPWAPTDPSQQSPRPAYAKPSAIARQRRGVGGTGKGNRGFCMNPAASQGWSGCSSVLDQVACRACWEVCGSASNPGASASAGSLRAPLPAKGQTCVLFTPDLTYVTYRNLQRFNRFHLGFF